MPKHEAMAFQSPPSLLARFTLPNRGVVQGMGVRAGNTLCVGGGFHGKSTVLKALEAGVYNKVPGDGRELVVTHPTAVKVRAEDGRSVAGVDISAFINNLPRGRPTHDFYTSDASGSTSQAASLLEVGASPASVAWPLITRVTLARICMAVGCATRLLSSGAGCCSSTKTRLPPTS